MHKFKVGDRVRIVKKVEPDPIIHGFIWTRGMDFLLNERTVCEITDIDHDEITIAQCNDNDNWNKKSWCIFPECLELVEESDPEDFHVGDHVRYLGLSTSFLTHDKTYVVSRVDDDETLQITNEKNLKSFYLKSDFKKVPSGSLSRDEINASPKSWDKLSKFIGKECNMKQTKYLCRVTAVNALTDEIFIKDEIKVTDNCKKLEKQILADGIRKYPEASIDDIKVIVSTIDNWDVEIDPKKDPE